MSAPLFSVVVIARNEAKTLPRLIKSLSEFQKRGGEIVVCDTGSSDDTVKVANELGAITHHYSSAKVPITRAMAQEINQKFVSEGEQPIVEPFTSFFDFSRARNHAASLATREFIAMPDCDEIYTALDIDRINQCIQEGAQRFEYEFVFSHDENGKPLRQFRHSKFYNRAIFRWVGMVHEVLHGTGSTVYLPEQSVKLEHWQNPDTNRSNYLPGLAVDCWQNPDNDRNSHYLARELMWSGRPKSALREFDRHIKMNRWDAERAQSQIFMGDIEKRLGHESQAIGHWFQSLETYPHRREAWIRLAGHYYARNNYMLTVSCAEAALAIKYTGHYMDDFEHYRDVPHWLAYWGYCWLGRKPEASEHWCKCIEHEPTKHRYLHDARFVMTLPKVSIVIPTLGREDRLAQLLKDIDNTANYPDYEVIVERDSFEDRQGCPRTFNRGVEKASGPLVCYLSNDVQLGESWLIQAVLQLLTDPSYKLVALNDGLWNGKLATHWLAWKRFQRELPDHKFFHEGYNHVGCDNELTAWAIKWGVYAYAPLSKVTHQHQLDQVHHLAWDPDRVKEDRELLKKRAHQFRFCDTLPA